MFVLAIICLCFCSVFVLSLITMAFGAVIESDIVAGGGMVVSAVVGILTTIMACVLSIVALVH